ncbi:hypothetical protein L798_11056 [Zootermopsis nevadensis]|uniref:Uncharacterized protein n=1 Tax=Zootermopsis nevadensis TaxID=136037 RepID=A0A067QZZ1_ZOONE|nr:hypothetical protein L798_11056 [Zootermopsis nevadensis]
MSEGRWNASEPLSQVAYHRTESTHDIRKWVFLFQQVIIKSATSCTEDAMLQTCFHLTTVIISRQNFCLVATLSLDQFISRLKKTALCQMHWLFSMEEDDTKGLDVVRRGHSLFGGIRLQKMRNTTTALQQESPCPGTERGSRAYNHKRFGLLLPIN